MAGKEHAYRDPEIMYKDEDINAVYIATPHNLHKKMIKQALQRGKHVFCEKPVTISVNDAREISALDKKYGKLKIGFNYQYRYDPNCYNLAFGVKNGHLGKIFYANCNIFFSREIDYFKNGPWRARKETAGGTLLIHGSHIIDIIIWAMGEPISVVGVTDNLKFKNLEVEDISFGIIKFKTGCYAQINYSIIIKPQKRRINDQIELKIFGENGGCHYEGPWPGSSLKWYGVDDLRMKENLPGMNPFSECIKAYGNWVLHDEPFFNTVEESSKVLSLILSLYKSSESRKRESIDKL